MKERNLPIKLVLQKSSDVQKNQGRGNIKFFGDVTQELQQNITTQFEDILDFYKDVFLENELIPAVGKITVKPEAIAKSHKPNELCRYCNIIGGKELNQIYIKVTKESVEKTISLVQNPTSERLRANMTAIQDIQPIRPLEKISDNLTRLALDGKFQSVCRKIKIKLFDFDDEFCNTQITRYVVKELEKLGFENNHKVITYGENIKYIKVVVESFQDITSIANINGIKFIDFFQTYSLPLTDNTNTDLQILLNENLSTSEVNIGIIDGGISTKSELLKPYILKRCEYIPKEYINEGHGTFIASTILYGNKLNGITSANSRMYKFIDIVAVPNGDKNWGPTDGISEEELMEIIEDVMKQYSSSTKIWNMSLGVEDKICDGSMSDLGIFLDYIQDKYNVQFFVSSGNLNQPPLRKWPSQSNMGERDRIISPADSVRAITVGSIALHESEDSIVKLNEPSPFSRRGPGANYIIKPDVVDYGGNISHSFSISGLGMKGLDVDGKVIEDIGTSFSTPRLVQKFASVYDEMVEKDLLLAKAMIIHSARMNSRELLDQSSDNIKYYGFGMPSVNASDILHCSEDEVTLIFKQSIRMGTHLEMIDFPYPKSLIKDGKCFGEICMTLVYNPVLDEKFGQEYCRVNIDASFGIYWFQNQKMSYKGQVPVECTWDEKFEQSRVENGFKWSPVKSYHRKIGNSGIKAGDGWKIRIDMSPRNNFIASPQEFVLIITIKSPLENDIYSEVINGLRERGYITNNLETRQQIRYKN